MLVLYVAWVVLYRNRHIGASERRQLIPHVRFQVLFLGPKSQLKSGFACAGLLCSKSRCFLLKKRSCIFVWTGRPLLLILRFCGLIFGTARGQCSVECQLHQCFHPSLDGSANVSQPSPGGNQMPQLQDSNGGQIHTPNMV